MKKPRLFLKLDTTEHRLLKVTQKEAKASSYRDLIMSLIDSDYLDYLCNASLTERALRKILVNLHQLENGYAGDGDISSLIAEIESIANKLVSWNNDQIRPLSDSKGTVHEVQIRLAEKDKALVSLAKSATGFRTYGDLIIHLCYSYLSSAFDVPLPIDYTLFDKIGIEINKEAKAYNTVKHYDKDNLERALETLYELIIELEQNLNLLGGNDVSEH